nr:RNA-directed DNA polymerase, eukaryota [Tanacetum cinerariifolium]
MESMDLLCVRMCWGNLAFEYAQSDSVGNSSGILCVWDSNSFVKHNVTRLNYFVMLRGVWWMTGQLVLLIVVYAPQEVSEKRLLWDYLQSEICKWNGEVVIMGDFNEVWYKSDRYGSKFNAHSAMVFNSFILNSGLVEVKKEFRDHFSKRFCKPGLRNVNIQMTFSNQISVDQKRDLEGEVTNDEIKKAVWDCGMDKASGPD